MSSKQYLTIQNIVLLILGTGSLILLIHAIMRNYKIDKIKSWPKVNAVVIDSSVQVKTVYEKNMLYHNKSSYVTDSSSSTRYYPKISYKYSVSGREHQSSNIIYGGARAYNSLDIESVMPKYAPGSTISVYYNPYKPAEAYIFNGDKTYMSMIISAVVLACVCWYCYKHNYADHIPGMDTESTPMKKVYHTGFY